MFVVGKTIMYAFSAAKQQQQQHSRIFDSCIISQHLKLELTQTLELKGIGIPCSVFLSTSINDVSKAITTNQAEYIKRRQPQQVASQDYVINFKIYDTVQAKLVEQKKISYKQNGVGEAISINLNSYDVILKKGEPISQAISRTYYIVLEEEESIRGISM